MFCPNGPDQRFPRRISFLREAKRAPIASQYLIVLESLIVPLHFTIQYLHKSLNYSQHLLMTNSSWAIHKVPSAEDSQSVHIGRTGPLEQEPLTKTRAVYLLLLSKDEIPSASVRPSCTPVMVLEAWPGCCQSLATMYWSSPTKTESTIIST